MPIICLRQERESHLSEVSQIVLDLADEEATLDLGRCLSPLLGQGDFVALRGSLGAGKTTLARGLIQAAQALHGVPERITSPTFTLVQTYQAGSLTFWHFDLYRVEAETEVRELGLDEAVDEGTALVEWPERLGAALPEDRLDIELKTITQGRQAILEGWGNWRMRLNEIRTQKKLGKVGA